MSKKHVNLQPTEGYITQAAAQIYAAYITVGRVPDGEEAQWMQRSIREAIMIAQATDDAIICMDEVDSSEDQGMAEIRVGRLRQSRSRHDS